VQDLKIAAANATMQMWHLLDDKITVMEGFKFLGLGPVKERVEVNLCKLCAAEGSAGEALHACQTARVSHWSLPGGQCWSV
jgi:hypothetical protein